MKYSPTLPAGSSLGKSYEYGFDVYNGPSVDAMAAVDASPLWLPVRRALNIAPNMTPVQQTAQTYDDLGSQNNDTVAWNFTLGASAFVNRSVSTGLMVPELQAIYDRMGDTKGEDAKIGIRWYHKPSDGSAPNPKESWKGLATVAPTRGNVAPDGANELSNITFTGTGPAQRSTYIFDGWADDTSLPVILGITPEGQSIGDQIRIDGSSFDGATGVTIEAVAAQFTLVSGSTIVATIPAGAVGPADVIVTTPDGPSVPLSYTVAA
jgi:hypothetical protein